ncbi:IS6 family transposase [Microbulbifer sp. OS29]|uniref:IS6 family transposase n=1 Tax=Microbulbifer okhotskensis TaxID=2926617 RepID=A0A9X2J7S9_9GAMM|nr:IS6 family transposase [Microbulbifer okhotskensis]MCO1336899.1 IS6 family transposase [Microbulbifer okhotskensis]
MLISFKGTHYPKDVILYAVFFYVRYAVSYRDLEEIMQERGITVDHATLNRWVVKYSSQIAAEARKKKCQVGTSWRMDETYIKVKGRWVYLYRAVDKSGETVDFMLSETRDETAATRFFQKSIDSSGLPEKVVIDKSGANLAGLTNINIYLFLMGFWLSFIDTLQVKYLNNIVEQDHRFIKRITKPMMGFKAFHSAVATLDGIETAHMIRKGQLGQEGIPAYRQFMALAG